MDKYFCSLNQLAKILHLNYATTLSLKKELQPVKVNPRLSLYSSDSVEDYLIKTKENQFEFLFEKDECVQFFDRLIKKETFDITKLDDQWLDPTILKFLLNWSAWDLTKLRKSRKVIFKSVPVENIKKGIRNNHKYVYEKESVINYITNEIGEDNLRREFKKLHATPQFYTVAGAVRHMKTKGHVISNPTLYRHICKNKYPACRFHDSIRIPILEFEQYL